MINGTQINYYFICKTKLWLFSHNIQLEHESENVKLGKILHEASFKREKDYLIDNLINVDFIKVTDSIEIHEVKRVKKWINHMNFSYYTICIILKLTKTLKTSKVF
ncbi:Dna2/Cas4 domain-containing protein [Methanobrevibacter sp. V14]|uniref:Dna2/Cas4 domain-containing protein n=1 Tax=Methanobrevibacter sp. V14 TaxID=3064280 RepID=UPI0027363329|nr:Dna2/Cas4 domain-containing protein [Methanobrevibacter sp. V14]